MRQILSIIIGLIILFAALYIILVCKTTLIPSVICLIIATAGFLFADISWGKFMIKSL